MYWQHFSIVHLYKYDNNLVCLLCWQKSVFFLDCFCGRLAFKLCTLICYPPIIKDPRIPQTETVVTSRPGWSDGRLNSRKRYSTWPEEGQKTPNLVINWRLVGIFGAHLINTHDYYFLITILHLLM